MIPDHDLQFVSGELKKLDLYDPTMKSTLKFMKLSVIIMIFICVLAVAVFLALVIPEDLKPLNFAIYGFCSIFFIALVISILSCIFFKIDCDKMLNREIQIREKLNKINVDNYIARGVVWKVTKFGAFLKAKKLH
jgi:glucan phosphoethanolaminetransferase (alkaline phosphatase superfamily)